jgi:DNA-binding response OmpR family regulator
MTQSLADCADPKSCALLRYLVEHRDKLVNKQDLFDNVRPGVYVVDEALISSVISTSFHRHRIIIQPQPLPYPKHLLDELSCG